MSPDIGNFVPELRRIEGVDWFTGAHAAMPADLVRWQLQRHPETRIYDKDFDRTALGKVDPISLYGYMTLRYGPPEFDGGDNAIGGTWCLSSPVDFIRVTVMPSLDGGASSFGLLVKATVFESARAESPSAQRAFVAQVHEAYEIVLARLCTAVLVAGQCIAPITKEGVSLRRVFNPSAPDHVEPAPTRHAGIPSSFLTEPHIWSQFKRNVEQIGNGDMAKGFQQVEEFAYDRVSGSSFTPDFG